MSSARRRPLTPPKPFARDCKKAEFEQCSIIVDGIHILPPTVKRKTWRVVAHIDKQRYERSGGRSIESVYAAFLELLGERQRSESSRYGRPEHEDVPLATVIDEYLRRGGRSGTWKPKTLRQRQGDFRVLRKLAVKRDLICTDLNASILRIALHETVATSSRAETVLRAYGAFLRWGWQAGFFASEQSVLTGQVRWTPPIGYEPQKTRKQRAMGIGAQGHGQLGQIPTPEQVHALAVQTQRYHTYGQGIVMCSAYLGTRINELAAFTADPAVGRRGFGNYVDLERNEVVIVCQLGDGTSVRSTKTDSIRRTAIPTDHRIVNNFDLRAFLDNRSRNALEEQKQGRNPLALLFTSATGRPLRVDNFRSRAFRRAARDLGWELEPTTDAKGVQRTMLRFGIHTLRDFFAVTALYEWGYTDLQLMQQGGWKSVDTIRRHYMGTTDATLSEVHEIHGRSTHRRLRAL